MLSLDIMSSQVALLCFFACIRLLDVLREGNSRIVWNALGTEYRGLFIPTYDRVPYSEVHVTYAGPLRCRVRVGVNTMTETATDLGVKSVEEIMQIAKHWLSDKRLSDVCVRFDNRTVYRRFAKTFVYPLFSADVTELGLVSNVSVNPARMQYDYRIPAKAIAVVNYMNRIDTLLDALQHINDAHFYVGHYVRVDTRDVINPTTGVTTQQFEISGGRRTKQKSKVATYLKSRFDSNNTINFFCENSRLHLDLYYTYPAYCVNQPYLSEVLTPL